MEKFKESIWGGDSIMLEVKDMHVFYGSSHILHGINLSVKEHEIVCLLGRNGAGKTTTLRAIMGLVKHCSGSIRLMGKETKGSSPSSIAHEGVGFVFEDRRIFPRLTVRQNLEVGKKASRRGKSWSEKDVYEMFPSLAERQYQLGRSLSGGEQQMLAIARTMMGNPRLILIDEPMEGLAPLVIGALRDGIRRLREEGSTIFLSEQNVVAAMEMSNRCYVLDKGKVYFEGSINELKEREDVLDTYLGVKFVGHA
jgi:branched-chain amino acid transport system ATP-binding protein